MLKDAALLVLDLQIALSKRNLTLKDAHGWNVLFDGPSPLQVDVGSIARHKGGPWSAEDEFRRFFVNPLRLYRRKKNRVARLLLTDFDIGVAHSDVHRFVISTFTFRVIRRLKMLARRFFSRDEAPQRTPAIQSLVRLQQRIRRIDVTPKEGEWSNYYKEAFPAFEPSTAWSAKHHAINDVLARLRPSTVFDIGSNSGWYAELAARLGAKVVAVDPDETAIDTLYRRIRESELKVLPLVLDIRRPTPAQGMGYRWFQDATTRFTSELVLALGLVHHLVFKANLAFDVIVETLSSYSSRWLVVEFVPPDDQFVREWAPEEKPWYSLEVFEATLSQHMTHIATIPSDPSPRVILVYDREPVSTEADGSGSSF